MRDQYLVQNSILSVMASVDWIGGWETVIDKPGSRVPCSVSVSCGTCRAPEAVGAKCASGVGVCLESVCSWLVLLLLLLRWCPASISFFLFSSFYVMCFHFVFLNVFFQMQGCLLNPCPPAASALQCPAGVVHCFDLISSCCRSIFFIFSFSIFSFFTSSFFFMFYTYFLLLNSSYSFFFLFFFHFLFFSFCLLSFYLFIISFFSF